MRVKAKTSCPTRKPFFPHRPSIWCESRHDLCGARTTKVLRSEQRTPAHRDKPRHDLKLPLAVCVYNCIFLIITALKSRWSSCCRARSTLVAQAPHARTHKTAAREKNPNGSGESVTAVGFLSQQASRAHVWRSWRARFAPSSRCRRHLVKSLVINRMLAEWNVQPTQARGGIFFLSHSFFLPPHPCQHCSEARQVSALRSEVI